MFDVLRYSRLMFLEPIHFAKQGQWEKRSFALLGDTAIIAILLTIASAISMLGSHGEGIVMFRGHIARTHI